MTKRNYLTSMLLKSSIVASVLMLATSAANAADPTFIGEFHEGTNSWPFTYPSSYTTFTVGENATVNVSNNPGGDTTGAYTFQVIPSTGDLATDLASGERIECTWTNGDMFNPTTTSFQAKKDVTYIFYRDSAPYGDFICTLTTSDPDPSTGIKGVETAEEIKEVKRFTADGRSIDKPQKGINIIVMSDGSIRKIIVK